MLLINDCVTILYLLVPSAWKVVVCLWFCDSIYISKSGANAIFLGFCNHCIITDIRNYLWGLNYYDMGFLLLSSGVYKSDYSFQLPERFSYLFHLILEIWVHDWHMLWFLLFPGSINWCGLYNFVIYCIGDVVLMFVRFVITWFVRMYAALSRNTLINLINPC